ncbi:MAG TPA: hypothetical protein ENJ00_04070 [Phycisphaerales bacterium]|nr:hypothetical protein [Phycisphaerales bacterium]
MGDKNYGGTLDAADSSAWVAAFNATGGTVGGPGVLSPWLDNHIGLRRLSADGPDPDRRVACSAP